MSAKQKFNRKPAAPLQVREKGYANLICVFIIALYLLVDFIPEWGAVDVVGSQWVYLAVINFISIVYIYYAAQEQRYEQVLKKLLGNFLTIAYLALFVLAGISIFFAVNKVEGLVCYAYFTISIIAFFNIAILLSRNISVFNTLAQIIAIILLVQALPALINFLNGMNNTPLDALVLSLKGNTGNKNIFAASLAIKLAFVMYCVYTLKSWFRFIYIPTLMVGATVIWLVNARSAYLSLVLQVSLFLGFSFLKFLKDRQLKVHLARVGAVLVPIIFSFFVAQALFNNAKQMSNTSSNSGSIIERFESVVSKGNSSNAARLQLWSSGFDYIKNNPIIGSGYGNCKLAIVSYENQFMSGFEFNQHLHNDFIETAMELGIVGGVLFVFLFIGMLIAVVRIWKSKANDQLKTIAAFSLIALVGYFIDALFNFPCERPIMQLLFALVLAIHVSMYIQHAGEDGVIKSNKTPFLTIFIIVVAILSIFAAYYRVLTYQSLVAQSLTIPDFPNQATHSSQEVSDKLPQIPNLDANNTPIDVVKAWYLSKEGKYDEALILLNKSTQVNPYSLANEFVKAQVFLQTNKLDSAYYYANKGFITRPTNIGFYALLNDINKQKGDVNAVKNTFKKCITRVNSAAIWDNYLSTLMALHVPDNELIQAIDSALRVFPGDKAIQEKKLLVSATLAMNTSNFTVAIDGFSKLASLNPSRFNYIENIGVCYFALKKYDQALPYLNQVIDAKAYGNGKAEYFKGLCLFNMGKKVEGCTYLQVAGTKNYPGALNIVATYCK